MFRTPRLCLRNLLSLYLATKVQWCQNRFIYLHREEDQNPWDLPSTDQESCLQRWTLLRTVLWMGMIEGIIRGLYAPPFCEHQVYQELSQPRPQGFSLKKIGKSPGDEVGAKQSRTKLKRISLKCLRVANFVENARLRRIKLVAFTKIRI